MEENAPWRFGWEVWFARECHFRCQEITSSTCSPVADAFQKDRGPKCNVVELNLVTCFFCSKFGLIKIVTQKFVFIVTLKWKGVILPPPIQQQPPHPTLTRCSLELAPFFGPKHDEEVTSSQWTSLSLSRAVRANLKRHRGISAVHANCERPWQMSRRISTQENNVPHERSENLNHNSIKFKAA